MPLVASCGDAESFGPVEEGVWQALAQHRRATLSGLSYRYDLTIPESASEPVSGEVFIDFRFSDPSSQPLVVDFRDPTERVTTVAVNGSEVEWRGDHDHIVIPSSAIASGSSNRLAIAFTAGDEALNRNPEFLYTLFVPDRAHFSLPVFDQPDLKAPVSFVLTVPAGWRAVANGRTTSERNEGASVVLEFAPTQPIPPYLFAFAAGEFHVEAGVRDGRTMRLFHRETDAEKVAANVETVFDLHAAALSWLEDYTGLPYPYGKLDFVLIPPFQYGGMEHPGSIFYRQSSLFLDESATQGQILGRASLIAHETAHQWFGDLVTMAWFEDVWMKEVFANFMAAKIVHPSFPELDHDLRFFLAHHNTAYGVDRTDGANPIRQPLHNLREAGTLYGAIIYQKAPVVMRQLELLIGEEELRDGLREYLVTYRHGNATWPDLIEILDRASDQDLRAWSRVWVEESGRPRVTAQVLDDGRGRLDLLAVYQEDLAGEDRIWPQSLEVVLGYGDSIDRVPVQLTGAAVGMEDWVGKPRPDFVLPNGSGYEYGHFHLDSLSLRYLADHLTSVPDARIRGIGWVTLWDAVLEGELDPARWYDLLLVGVTAETEEQSLQRVLGFLGETFWDLFTPEERTIRVDRTERALWEGVGRSEKSTVRAAYFNAWRGTVSSPGGVERLRRIWAGEEAVEGLSFSENDRTAMSAALALRGVPEAEAILDRQLDEITNPDRRARFEYVRDALSDDPGVREAFFDRLREPENREREPWVLTGLGYLHHPLRGEHPRRFVLPALEMVHEIQRTGDIFFPKRWLDATLGRHNHPAVADDVKSFVDALPQHYPARLRGKILQSADAVFRSARIVYGWDP